MKIKKRLLLSALALTTLALAVSMVVWEGQSDLVGANLAGSSYVAGYDYKGRNGALAEVIQHQGETMVITRVLAEDPSAHTGNLACAKITGANGRPMVCKNNVESFPYLGNKGCKRFYPRAAERVSTFPGHGAHGGHYDIFCSRLRTRGIGGPEGGTCSAIAGDTCTTCPQCAKNMDCGESIGGSSDFANGVIVRCFESLVTLESSMELRMTFDQPAEPTFDTSGKGNHGANYGAAFTGENCRSNRCAGFNGGTDYIDAQNVFNLSGDMAMAIWVKTSSMGRGGRIMDVHQPGNGGVNVYFDTGRIVLDNGGGPGQVLPTGFGYADNRWHHVAVSRSGNTYSLYVDGQLVGTRTGTAPTYTGYTLGRWNTTSSYLQGHLDEAYVFSKALSQTEVQQVMNAGVPAQEEPPQGSVAGPAISPSGNSTIIDDRLIALVRSGETGADACARHGKVCLGYAYKNREICQAFYPGADMANFSSGGPRDFFCQAGSNQSEGPCVGTSNATCGACVSCGEEQGCEDVLVGVDAAFAECDDPFTPETYEVDIPSQGDPLYDPGSGLVEYSLTATHPDRLPTVVSVQYAEEGSDVFFQAHIDSALSDPGTVDVNNEAEFQIGSGDPLDTDLNEAVEVIFYWDTREDEVEPGEYVIRVSVRDSKGNIAFDTTDPFFIGDEGDDAIIPDGLREEDESDEEDDGLRGSGPGGSGDIDGDGIPNEEDDDIDGDGVPNGSDGDVDGDGRGNGVDDDVDGDGVPNGEDDDVDGDGATNDEDDDIDGDGLPNGQDPDTDGDGTLNGDDSDVDGDGVPNGQDNDVDGDGQPNGQDSDVDGDGVSNGEDNDVDGDGVTNDRDNDVDGDGQSNGEDGDVDGDGLANGTDPDVDGDGYPNGSDPDIDGDGRENHEDDDVDGDGVPNTDDSDVDGDGSENGFDGDVDGDGILNVDDDDIDGDGRPNDEDRDADGDGVNNDQDQDADGDGTRNELDDSPNGSSGATRGSADDRSCLSSPGGCSPDEILELVNSRTRVDDSELLDGESLKVEFIRTLLESEDSSLSLEERLALFDDEMWRSEAVEMLVYLLYMYDMVTAEMEADAEAISYPDIAETNGYRRAILIATLLNIVEGYPDGSFRPLIPPNKAEVARMLVQFMAQFSDVVQRVLEQETRDTVNDPDWFQKYINTLARFGIFLYNDYGDLGEPFGGQDFLDLMVRFARSTEREDFLEDLLLLQ